MEYPVIDLNDCGITVFSADGHQVTSPGFAVIQSGEICTGERARAQARLMPRQTNSRFWQRLGTEPLHTDDGAGVRHHADLAFAHLRHLHELAGAPKSVVLAVPGSFDRTQLGILLGLIEQCPFSAAGIVDAAVVAGSTVPASGQVTHVDLQLHQLVLTELHIDDNVSRLRVDVIPDAGLARLLDGWARLIAEAFVRQCRFDPLHDAKTEQRLYDNLGAWLDEAGQDEQVLSIEAGGVVHRAKLTRQELLAGAEPIYAQWRAALQRRPATLLSHRLAELPEFAPSIEHVGVIPGDAVLKGSLQNWALICANEGGLRFVNRLPHSGGPGSALLRPGVAAAPRPASAEAPTTAHENPAPASHLLLGNQAWPLRGRLCLTADPDAPGGVRLQRNGDTTAGISILANTDTVRLEISGDARVDVNGDDISSGRSLRCGDRLRLAHSAEMRLIQVVDHDPH